jgi:hypothetical protein
MTIQTSNFKTEADKIRVEPPRSAWKQIEAQLDADGSRRKIKIARMINYAAAVVLITLLGVIGLYLNSSQADLESSKYSFSLEVLNDTPSSDISIYNVEKVRDLSTYFVSR